MPTPFSDSKERPANAISDGMTTIRISREWLKFWIQVLAIIVTTSFWGWVNSKELAQQGGRVDLLEKKIELLRYDMTQLQITVAGRSTNKEP